MNQDSYLQLSYGRVFPGGYENKQRSQNGVQAAAKVLLEALQADTKLLLPFALLE